MDPEACWDELLELAREVEDGAEATGEAVLDEEETLHAADRMSELVIAFNEWVHKGGFLPESWSRENQHPLRAATVRRGENDFDDIRQDFGEVFVALGDAFFCERCAVERGVDLSLEETQTWAVGGDGWLAPVVCVNCRFSIPVIVNGREDSGLPTK